MYLGTVSKTGTGRSAIVAADHFQAPFNIGVAAKVSGTVSFNIEYSMDAPEDAATATWFVATGFSGLSATTGGAFTVPCRMLSINVASGSGSVTADFIQAGPV